MPVKLVEVTRSGIIESVHRGDVVVADSKGRVLFVAGNPKKTIFLRSSGKPIIAIGSLETGIAEEYELDLKEISIMTSSHSGEREHIEVLNSIMNKTHIDDSFLQCGIQTPMGKKAMVELYKSGKDPTELHCNCSAKHLGVLAAAKKEGLSLQDYKSSDHPIQKKIAMVVSDFCGIDVENLRKGIDGCGIPVFAMPLVNAATAYANLCCDKFMDGKYLKSQNYVLSAMSMYPEMVAGSGRIETELMKRFGNRVIAKSGAEGMFCGGLPGRGIGIALKIEDGSIRAANPVFMEVLLQIGVLKEDELDGLYNFWKTPVKTHNGENVGLIKPVFKLKKMV